MVFDKNQIIDKLKLEVNAIENRKEEYKLELMKKLKVVKE